MNNGYPEWMIYGMEVDDPKHPDIHVALYASNRLSVVELERIFDRYNNYPDPRPDPRFIVSPTVEHIRLTACMFNYHVVYAGSYVEAWARLFNVWDPAKQEDRSTIQIAPSQKLLEEGGG